jgi:hypothetical protein
LTYAINKAGQLIILKTIKAAKTGLRGAFSIANLAYGLGVTAGMGAVKSYLNSRWLTEA